MLTTKRVLQANDKLKPKYETIFDLRIYQWHYFKTLTMLVLFLAGIRAPVDKNTDIKPLLVLVSRGSQLLALDDNQIPSMAHAIWVRDLPAEELVPVFFGTTAPPDNLKDEVNDSRGKWLRELGFMMTGREIRITHRGARPGDCCDIEAMALLFK